MISRSDAVFGRLSWSQINNLEYQLRGDGRVLAALRADDSLERSMIGEAGNRKWTFKRTGLFRISVRVCAEGDDADCATLVKSGEDKYTVSFPDGQSLQWRRTNNRHRQEWAFFDVDGAALIVFRPVITNSKYQARVGVSAAGRALSDLYLLVLLGWYDLVSKYRDDAAKSAIIIATAWGAT
jgi:hypothetical protein